MHLLNFYAVLKTIQIFDISFVHTMPKLNDNCRSNMYFLVSFDVNVIDCTSAVYLFRIEHFQIIFLQTLKYNK